MTKLNAASRFVDWGRVLFPNPVVASIVLAGTACEAVLLSWAPHNVYSSDIRTMVFAIAFLAWFWITSGLVLWLIATLHEWLDNSSNTSVRIAARGGVSLLVSLCALLYGASWGLYLRTSRFMNWECLFFLVENPPSTLWFYLRPVERIGGIAMLIVSALLFAATPLMLGRVACSRWEGKSSDHGHRAWRFVSMLLLVAALPVIRDVSPHRRGTRLDYLRHSVNPAATVAVSSIELAIREPVEACLDTRKLTPIAQYAWSPPHTTGAEHRPSVIFLAIESLRHDVVHLVHQGREVTPHLNRLAKSGMQFTRAYAQSTHSDYSDVCIVSSLYPLRTRHHHYYRRGDPWPKTLAFDIFKKANYRTAIISSQNESWSGMDRFLETPNLDLFYDASRSGASTYVSPRDPGFAHEISVGALSAGSLRDSHTMDKAIKWVTHNVQSGQPFFLSMNFQSSHFPYELPDSAERPFQPCGLAPDVSFLQYPIERLPQVRNAYLNGIHQCDVQLGRMVAALQDLGILERTILVVLGENGESFHEIRGVVGHAREPVESAIHVTTIIHAPSYLEPGMEAYPLEHVDLLPTVLGLLNWPQHPCFQGIDALSEDRPPLHHRFLYFHVNSPAANADALLYAGRWKFLFDHRWQESYLVDLLNDPLETTDVSRKHAELAEELKSQLFAWRRRQLAYYHFPFYYRNYYPPSPPRPVSSVMNQLANRLSESAEVVKHRYPQHAER